MKRRLRVGKNFDAKVEILQAKKELARETVRSRIALGLFSIAVVFLVGAAIHGLASGSFDALEGVWIVLAAPLGAIISHYFGQSNSGRHEKDK